MKNTLVALKRRYPDFLDGSEGYFHSLCRFLSTDWQWKCGAESLLHISLLPDGKVSACCAYPAIIGDIKKQQLQDILHGGALETGAFHDCPGCCRRDYHVVKNLFDRPLHSCGWGGINLLRKM